MDAVVEPLLRPLDRVRTALYRRFAPWIGPWMRNRERRVAAMGIAMVFASLVMAVEIPLWLLALGPVLLGVPHVVADLRYLWVQPSFHRQRRVWLAVVPGLVVGAVTAQLWWGLLAAGAGLFALPGTAARRRAAGLCLLLPALYAAHRWPMWSNWAFAHLHNVIAVGLWWWLWPHGRADRRWVLIAYVGVSALVALGALDPVLARAFHAGPDGGPSVAFYAASLAPGLSGPAAWRVVALYAFGQSVHYAIWLRLIPEHARRRVAPRSFVQSYRALRADLGAPLLAGATVAALLTAGWALWDLAAARGGYLRFALVHGYLELAAAALLFARGQPLAPGR